MNARGWMLPAGLLLMVVASVWAPPQPELLQNEGACEVAPCGMLEDPARWRNAWWVWWVGFTTAVLAAAVILPPRRRPVWWMLIVLAVVLPFYMVGLAVVAMIVSLFTSVQGATTTFVAGLLLPGVAALSAWARRAWADRGPVILES